MLKVLSKSSEFIDKIISYICIVLFIIMALSASLQVITRYVFSYSFSWTEELCRYTFIWINMLGASICYKYGAHAVVDFHIKMLPEKINNIIFIIGDFLVLICGLLMVTQGWKMVMVTTKQPSPGMQLPMCYVYLCVVVSGIAVIVHALSFIAEKIIKQKQLSRKVVI